MKYILNFFFFVLLALTACTDKKNISNSTKVESKEEIIQIEKLTIEMDENLQSKDETSKKLDAILEEIDN